MAKIDLNFQCRHKPGLKFNNLKTCELRRSVAKRENSAHTMCANCRGAIPLEKNIPVEAKTPEPAAAPLAEESAVPKREGPGQRYCSCGSPLTADKRVKKCDNCKAIKEAGRADAPTGIKPPSWEPAITMVEPPEPPKQARAPRTPRAPKRARRTKRSKSQTATDRPDVIDYLYNEVVHAKERLAVAQAAYSAALGAVKDNTEGNQTCNQ